jgi:hypothetical protein
MEYEPYRGELVAYCAARRLFPAGGARAYLELLSAEQAGPAVLTRYRRAA